MRSRSRNKSRARLPDFICQNFRIYITMEKTVLFPEHMPIKNITQLMTHGCKHQHCVYLHEEYDRLLKELQKGNNIPKYFSSKMIEFNTTQNQQLMNRVRGTEKKYKQLQKELEKLEQELDNILRRQSKLKHQNKSLKMLSQKKIHDEFDYKKPHPSINCLDSTQSTLRFQNLQYGDENDENDRRTEASETSRNTNRPAFRKPSDKKNSIFLHNVETEEVKALNQTIFNLKTKVNILTNDNQDLLKFIERRNKIQTKRHGEIARFGEILQDLDL